MSDTSRFFAPLATEQRSAHSSHEQTMRLLRMTEEESEAVPQSEMEEMAMAQREAMSDDYDEPVMEEEVSESQMVQPDLKVGAVDDPMELEAEEVARHVMRMPDTAAPMTPTVSRMHQIHRQYSLPDQFSEGNGMLSVSREAIARASRGGESLSSDTRSFFEPRFGENFSDVRVHTGSEAAGISESIQAKAFTTGNDIYFARGEYQPDTEQGKRLLAHELTHVVQQGGVAQTIRRYPGVVPDQYKLDKERQYRNPATQKMEPIYNEKTGYIQNPARTRLKDIVVDGKVQAPWKNVKVMYVVDEKGEVWVGMRKKTRLPHPTLIGGKDPKVLAAGMMTTEGSKIVRFDNHSGHFRPPDTFAKHLAKALSRFDNRVFRDLKIFGFAGQIEGKDQFKEIDSLRLTMLRGVQLPKFLKNLQWKNLMAKYRGRQHRIRNKAKGGGKGIAGLLISFLGGYLFSSISQKFDQKRMEAMIASLQPEVEKQLLFSLAGKEEELAELYAKNPESRIYMNMRFGMVYLSTVFPGEGVETEFDRVIFENAGFDRAPWAESDDFETDTSAAIVTKRIYPLTMSVPLQMSELMGAG